MPTFIFGERKRFPHHPPDPLAQGIIPPLHVRGLAGVLADALVALFGKDAGVGVIANKTGHFVRQPSYKNPAQIGAGIDNLILNEIVCRYRKPNNQ